jgi:cation diffusion facilitator family transporter
MGNTSDLYRQARSAALWGIGVNLGLGLVKLVGGHYGHSFALQTDAVHSLVDAVISATLLGALVYAERPADREHPYGHTRAEAVVGALVAVVLIVLALGIGREAWLSFNRPRPRPHGFTLVIAAVGAMVQEGLARFATRTARRSGSQAVLATAWDYRLDALGSLLVVVGVALAKWGGPRWERADHVVAGIVVATILWVGLRLFWQNVQELMDRQADPAILDEVRAEALGVPGVLDVETLRIRKAGLEYLVDIHVEVDPELSVRQGHAIAHAVKDRLRGCFPAIRDVLVHVEPAGSVAAPGPVPR